MPSVPNWGQLNVGSQRLQKYLEWSYSMNDKNHVKCTVSLQIVQTEGTKTTYGYIEVQSHSIVHWTGRFSCLIPVLVCILCYRCRSLQSCRLYWSQWVDHLREYQDYHSWQLEIIHETVFDDSALYMHVTNKRVNDCCWTKTQFVCRQIPKPILTCTE